MCSKRRREWVGDGLNKRLDLLLELGHVILSLPYKLLSKLKKDIFLSKKKNNTIVRKVILGIKVEQKLYLNYFK